MQKKSHIQIYRKYMKYTAIVIKVIFDKCSREKNMKMMLSDPDTNDNGCVTGLISKIRPFLLLD